jgi:citrate synthase
MQHTYIHENLTQHLRNFRYDAHPMGMYISSLQALGTFYPGLDFALHTHHASLTHIADSNPSLQGPGVFDSAEMRNKQIFRILGKATTIAACTYRHRIGRPYNYPLNTLSYTENFLFMLDRLSENNYKPHPVLMRALDKIFIICADTASPATNVLRM